MNTATGVAEIVHAPDGTGLAATVFRHGAPGGSTVIVNSAMGVRQRFYRALAQHLFERGFNVVTYDYRGIGDSAPDRQRGFPATLRDWAEQDMQGVITWVRETLMPDNLFVLGHSVGAQILGLCEASRHVDALVAVASGSASVRHWRGLGRARLWFTFHLYIPLVTAVAGRLPGRLGFGETIPGGVAQEWARWARDPAYVRGRHRTPTDRRYDEFRAPILAWSMTDDDYAPLAATEALLAFYPSAQTELRRVRPEDAGVRQLGHFGWFRPEPGRPFWDATADWLSTPARAPAPHPL